MKLIRSYLKAEEIAYIVEEVLKKEDAIEQEILKNGLIAQLLCDEIVNAEDNTDIYNALMEEGIDLQVEVFNYYMIDKIIEKQTNVNAVVKEFVEKFEEKFGKDLKDFDTKKIMTELAKLKEEI